jgi:hypothetical protein
MQIDCINLGIFVYIYFHIGELPCMVCRLLVDRDVVGKSLSVK